MAGGRETGRTVGEENNPRSFRASEGFSFSLPSSPLSFLFLFLPRLFFPFGLRGRGGKAAVNRIYGGEKQREETAYSFFFFLLLLLILVPSERDMREIPFGKGGRRSGKTWAAAAADERTTFLFAIVLVVIPFSLFYVVPSLVSSSVSLSA